jgi:hypothetical protein
MKFMVTLILVATVVSTAAPTSTIGGSNAPADDSLVVAQRFCPNKRC